MDSPPSYETSTHLPTPTSAEELALFWKRFELSDEQDTINTYLGTRVIQDLEFVTSNDVRTESFRKWAENYLTVVAKNRLVRAIESYAEPMAHYKNLLTVAANTKNS
jgi:hypothetical protein